MFPLNNLAILLAVAVGCSVAGGIAGWKINSWKHASDRALEAETFNDAMEMAAKELANIEVKNVTIKQEIQGKVIERTYYRDCRHDPDVMLDINRILSGKPLSGSKLSGTDTADKQ